MDKVIKVKFVDFEHQKGKKENVYVGVASDETLDRDLEILRAKGIQTESFMKNPIMLFNHNFNQPIGKVNKIWVEDSKVLISFEIVDEKIKTAVDKGVLRAFSVGFIPKKIFYKDEFEQLKEYDEEFYNRHVQELAIARAVITDWEIYEVSIVSVPANPNAILEMKALGITPQALIKCSGSSCDEMFIPIQDNMKAVIPYSAHPDNMKVRNSTTWDKQKAIMKLRKWASKDCSGDTDKINWMKFRVGFAWYDETKPDNLTSYKFPHHWADCEGNFYVDRRGTQVAMLFCIQRRANISEEDNKKIYNHLRKHYEQDLKEEAPEYPEKALSFEEALKQWDMEHLGIALQEKLFDEKEIKEFVKKLETKEEKNEDEFLIKVILDDEGGQ